MMEVSIIFSVDSVFQGWGKKFHRIKKNLISSEKKYAKLENQKILKILI